MIIIFQRWLIYILIIVLLNGCGFQLRSAKYIPSQLCTIYLETPNYPDLFLTQLPDSLRSWHIQIVPTMQQAPFGLYITHITFTHDTPNITDTTSAQIYNYTYTVVAEIRDRHHKLIVGPKTFSSTRQLVLNVSQVYTPGSAMIIKQEMQREILIWFYYWLISKNTRDSLQF